ncbi:MAG: hypothetical protein Fur0025_23750 [Oscillatoriaceae cyanobacterium]
MAGLLRASVEGLKIVDMARRNLGWNKTEDAWCLAAFISQSTLKRFWARTAIRRENFINICKAVEIDNWEYIAEGYKLDKTEPLLAAAIADLPKEEAAPVNRNFTIPENLPAVRNWVGRLPELACLKSLLWGGYTAVCVVGLPGIGKTTLVSQLVRELPRENYRFVAVAWESLRATGGKPTQLDDIIDSLLLSLSNGEGEIAEGDLAGAGTGALPLRHKIEKLIKLLKGKPCLLVFDGVDAILQTGWAKGARYFAETEAEYAWFFQRLWETEHQSQVIFISRESLAELPPVATRELLLRGLATEDAVGLLAGFDLTGTAAALEELAARYWGHPLALELVAALVRDDELGGNVQRFLLDRNWLLLRELEILVEEVMGRLSEEERICLSRISVYQPGAYPLSFGAIAAQMPEMTPYQIRELIIRGLKCRKLLDYDGNGQGYKLHPLVRETAYLLLEKDGDSAVAAHRRAWGYFLSISQPESQWQQFEDIQPMLGVVYHACKAGDGEEARRAIERVGDFLQGCHPQLKAIIEDCLTQVEEVLENMDLPLLGAG